MSIEQGPMQWGDPRLTEHFWKNVHPEPNSGCWLWIAGTTKAGYGVVSLRLATGSGPPRRQDYAHRLTLRTARGAVPPGLVTDHLCRVPLCCNPQHLEAVTVKENNRRGMYGALRVRCKRGHEYTPETTGRHSNGNRFCILCKRALREARDRATRREGSKTTEGNR